jgi:hypothetical protein
VIEWLAEGANDLMDVLGQTDLDTQRPSWTGPQPGHWWLRRVCHEAAMHRWDAYAPSGRPEPIDADQARDGVEEVFEVFVPHRMQFDSLAGSGETIHLHATDIEDGEWRLELLADELRWERAHAKCDVAARGPVSDLLLLLWSRIPPSELETFGDTALLDRWQHAAAFSARPAGGPRTQTDLAGGAGHEPRPTSGRSGPRTPDRPGGRSGPRTPDRPSGRSGLSRGAAVPRARRSR